MHYSCVHQKNLGKLARDYGVQDHMHFAPLSDVQIETGSEIEARVWCNYTNRSLRGFYFKFYGTCVFTRKLNYSITNEMCCSTVGARHSVSVWSMTAVSSRRQSTLHRTFHQMFNAALIIITQSMQWLTLLHYIRLTSFFQVTWLSWHQKGKPFSILMNQEMMGWQWHQLDHMQIIAPRSRQITTQLPHTQF